MEELDALKRNIENEIIRVFEGGVYLSTFLDETKGAILENVCKKNGLAFYKNGGIINSEKNRYIISNYDVDNSSFKILVYKVKYNKKFFSINHRSLLGSLMSLGIERDVIGDILIKNDDVYFTSTKEISKFLLSEFKSVGKAPIELEICDYPVENEIKYEEKLYLVSSMRLDLIISNVYNFSRNESLEIIMQGEVFLNGIVNLNPSHITKENDIISVRHKGKFKIISNDGNSKSGKLKITIGKRV